MLLENIWEMLGLLKNKYKIRKLIKKISQVKIWLFFMKKSNLFSYLFIYYDRLLFNNTIKIIEEISILNFLIFYYNNQIKLSDVYYLLFYFS